MQILTFLKNLVTTAHSHKEESQMITPTITTVDLQFRRVTSRYARKGTMSDNKGYLKVGRDPKTGKFKSLKNK